MKIVVLDGYTLNPGDNPWTSIQQLGELIVHDRTPVDQIVDRAADAEIVLTNKTPLSAETLVRLPRLKFICVLATGYNVVDVTAARARGVGVSNVPVYGTDTVAEFVLSVLLNFYRQPQLHGDLVARGEWAKSSDFCFWRTPLRELAGKTFGIVGFGRIGRRVGELAAAFKMKVITHSPHRRESPGYPFAWRELPELFAEADVVSLHCRLTPENTGFVNRALIERMKPSAFLINTARGQLVREEDLAEALNSGRIAGAALDVLAVEPAKADNPLLQARNIIVTPHIAWATLEARQRLMQTTADNIAGFLAGRPINLVNG